MENVSSGSRAQRLVAELREPKPQYNELLFTCPARLPLEIYGLVETLTHRAGTSRNKMLNELIELGLEAVLAELDDETASAISEASAECQRVAIERNGGLFERGNA